MNLINVGKKNTIGSIPPNTFFLLKGQPYRLCKKMNESHGEKKMEFMDIERGAIIACDLTEEVIPISILYVKYEEL